MQDIIHLSVSLSQTVLKNIIYKHRARKFAPHIFIAYTSENFTYELVLIITVSRYDSSQ